jgi:hypothetical protein
MGSPEILEEVLDALAPVLEQAGYRKSARNYVGAGDGVSRVIQFQTSQLKKPEEASFTLNFFITSPAFHEAYTGKKFPKSAGSGEPVVQGGIGKLMPDGEAIWWSLAPEVSSKLIAGEVETLLKEKLFPFLLRFPSENALLTELMHGDALPGFTAMKERCRAVLLAKNGRKDEAVKALNALREQNAGEGLEGFRESIDQLSKRLELTAG